MSTITDSDLVHRYSGSRAPNSEPEAVAAIRATALTLARHVVAAVPTGEERDKSLRNLDDVVMWASSGYANR